MSEKTKNKIQNAYPKITSLTTKMLQYAQECTVSVRSVSVHSSEPESATASESLIYLRRVP